MSGPVIVVPKYAKIGRGFSRAEQIDALQHPGRRTDGSQPAASWITQCTDLRKAILLCGWCRQKFNARRHGYRQFYMFDFTGKTDGYQVNGVCLACKSQTILTPGGGREFIPEETYRLVSTDPLDARRAARARAGMTGVWTRVRQYIATRWGSPQPTDARAS